MTDLICVIKDGEILNVHPDALNQHIKLGWRAHERPAEPETGAIDVTIDAMTDPVEVQDTIPATRPGRPRKLKIVEES